MPKRVRRPIADSFHVEELPADKKWRPWRAREESPEQQTHSIAANGNNPPDNLSTTPPGKTVPYPCDNAAAKSDIIPIFDPETSDVFALQWLNKIEQLSTIHHWTENIRSYYMQSRLGGMAKLWHSSLQNYDLTWDQWKQELLKAFPCTLDYAEFLRDMLARRKIQNESMAQYYFQKNAMLTKLEIAGEKAVACIIDGLPSFLKAPARAGNYKAPSELYSCFLAVMEESKNKSVAFRPRGELQEYTGHRAGTSKPVDTRSKDLRNTMRCYRCNDPGHTIRRCPMNLNRPICTHCGKIGHKYDDCWHIKQSKPADTSAKPTTSVNMVSNEVNDTYFTNIKVNGVPMTAYLDSGAKINVASTEVSRRLGLPLMPCEMLIGGFGGGITKAIGCHEVKINIENISFDTTLVITNCPMQKAQIILGQPIINDPKVNVTINGNTLKIEEANIDPIFNILSINDIHIEEDRILVHCANDVVIPPLSAMLIDVDLSNVNSSGDVFVEARTRHCESRNYCIPSTLLSGSNGFINVRNNSQFPLLLNQGELLARGDRNFLLPSATGISVVNNYSVTNEGILTIDINKICSGSDKADLNEKLIQLLIEYSDCFSSTTHDLGCTDKIKMQINLNSETSICYRPYRLSIPEKEIVRDKINDLLENNIIRESSSPYCSPIILVRKKNGDYRLCVDYRKLNSITIKDKYPLPIIEEQIEKLGGKQVFISLDMSQGFYQIPLEENSISKTGFITPEGHYEFLRMPFGLANSPSVYQRLMDKILGPLRFGKVLPYMDDLLIAADNDAEALEILHTVLGIIRDSKLTLNLEKCKFLQREIEYLGYDISGSGVRPGMKKTEAVSKFREPANIHELRMFLGLTSYFRKFVRGYAVIAHDLYKLLKKNEPWMWTSDQQTAFEKLKTILTNRPVLALYNHTAETEVHTDASSKGIAGILLQRHDKDMRPVAYFSRKASKEESVYHSYELETLAVVESLKRFRIYLAGIEFKVVTDCSAVRETFEKRDLLPRIARWWLSIQEYNFHIVHRPGSTHKHVDALSRIPVDIAARTEVMVLDLLDWIVCMQSQDSKLRTIREKLELDGNDPDLSKDYTLKDNKLYRKCIDNELRLAVPKSGRWHVMRKYHDDIGHPGLKRCETLIKDHYWFPKMTRFVRKYVNSCIDCVYKRGQYGKHEGELHPIPKIDEPMHSLHIDHVGPFCKSRKGHSYLFVIVDSFTKFVWAKPCKSTRSLEVTSTLEEVFSLFGYPKRIISDRGTAFTSKTFADYCTSKQIRHVKNAVASPRSNGQVERFNRTLIEAINKSTTEEQNWDTCLPQVVWGINNTINSTTGFPAYRLMFKAKRSLLQGTGSNEYDTEETANIVRDKAKENIEKTSAKMKRRFDSKRRKPTHYKVNDLVLWNKSEAATKEAVRKLKEKYSGPYKISKCLGNDRYVITSLKGLKGYTKFSTIVASDVLRNFDSVADNHDDSSDSSVDSTEELIDLLEG